MWGGLLLATVLLAGCGSSKSQNASKASGSDRNLKGCTIGFTEFAPGSLNKVIEAGAKAAAEKAGVKVDFQLVNADTVTEGNIVRQFITQRVCGMVLNAASTDGSVQTFKSVHDAHIPLVCYEGCVNPNAIKQYVDVNVAYDTVATGEILGKAIGDYAKKNLPGQKVQIALLACEEFDVCKKRRAGLDKGLNESGIDYKIVGSQEAFAADTAASATDTLLTAHPNVNMIVSESVLGTDGAHASVRKLAPGHRPVVFGIGLDPDSARLLLDPDNIVQEMVTGDYAQQGHDAVEAAVALIKGEKPKAEQLVNIITVSRNDPGPVQEYIRKYSG